MKKYRIKSLMLVLCVSLFSINAYADDVVTDIIKQAATPSKLEKGDLHGGEDNNDTKNQCDTYNTLNADYLVSEFIYSDCFSTAFPHREAGFDIGDPDDEIGAPPIASSNMTCECKLTDYIKFVGEPEGMWFPIRVVEVVRGDGSCSPTQGKTTGYTMGLLTKLLNALGLDLDSRGNEMNSSDVNSTQLAGFKHFHSWKIDEDTYDAYTDIYSPSNRCFNSGSKGDDLETSVGNIYWSANDPFFSNMLYPEYALEVGLMYAADSQADKTTKIPASTILQATSCTIQTLGKGTFADDFTYWQGGCYPDNLPANGHFLYAKNLVDSSQLIVQRSVMFSGRTGGYASQHTAYSKTGWGNDWHICFSTPAPYPHKSGYKFSMLKPYTEVKDESDTESGDSTADSTASFGKTGDFLKSGNEFLGSLTGKVMDWVGASTKCALRWGASSTRWGTGRNSRNSGDTGETTDKGVMPKKNNKGNDAVYIVWRWVECCEP
ncbi:MAG: TraU family protein [Neisseriaceae bacterium]|nr:TraU family protein [Neisseriaceae bacterium]